MRVITKQLTTNKRVKALPIIIKRDGNVCFYCLMGFEPKVERWKREFDHLNNDNSDHRIENLVLAHKECNNKKKWDSDWQIKAHAKLDDNTKNGYVGVREKNPHIETSEEIDSNREFSKITSEYLIENLLPHKGNLPIEEKIDFKMCLDTITLRCHKLYGHASQNTIRRILDMFCCSEGDFEKIKQNGRWMIQGRKGR
ncbi:MAG: hypothetical protein HOD60_14540 [Candidatus Nitrosopelagicus sp.]|nr:hypothetical protein [Candidatus Nitrosopelagicus sp.]